MEDEATVPEGEVDEPTATPEAEAPEVDDTLEAEAEGEDEAVEEVEFDFGGNKLRIPKGAVPDELAEQIDKFAKGTWSDYTRGKQEVAEQRKAIEAQREAVEKLSSLTTDQLTLFSRGQTIRGELEQLQAIDVNQMWQSDPDRARRVSDRIAVLTSEFNKTVNELSTKEREVASAHEHEMQRVKEQGRAAIEKRVPGFSQKVSEVLDYVHESYGIDRAVLERDWPMNPATAELAYKAMLYDRMKSAKPQPKPAAPVGALKGKGGGAKVNPESMSPAQWMAWRNKQLAGK